MIDLFFNPFIMNQLKLIGLLLLLTLYGCETKGEFENISTNARITGFISEKCYCCWGWVIQIGSETIKTDLIPNLDYPLVGKAFPIEAKITIGDKIINCPESMFDYYEILEFKPIE